MTIRQDIAKKLKEGVSMEHILDSICESVCNNINREHLINRQDIHNIKTQYNIEGINRHANNLISVNAWILDMQALPYNPIIIYKEQGRPQPDNLDNLADDNFLLCIQTEFQRDMLKAFEYDTVYIDTTHGTNIYHFNLITLVVIDEYGEGIPVAWMLSNREDTISLLPFFEAIKGSSGVITPIMVHVR